MEGHRRSRTWWLAALLVLSGVAILGWWGGRTSLSLPDETTDAGPDGRASTPSSQAPTPLSPDRGSARQRALSTPLPDLATPLRDSWQGLQQRADAGDAGAACRLAAELEFCDGIRQGLDAASAMLADRDVMTAPSGDSAEAVALVNERRRALTAGSERLLEQSRQCEGVPVFSPQDRVRYWRNAALGGNVAAMRHYAVGNAFRMNDTLDNLDALRAYRSEAETLAQRAVDAGDLVTAMALASAYSPLRRGNRRYLLAQSVQPDAVRALALYLHVQQRIQADKAAPEPVRRRLASIIQTLQAELPPAALSQARAEAARYPAVAHSSTREHGMLLRVANSGATPGITREECAPTR